MKEEKYTSALGAGLGLVDETIALLDIWTPDINSVELYDKALDSGRFPAISARRLKNIIKECFSPRYLCNNAQPARIIKPLTKQASQAELLQLMFLFTARANPILYDFMRVCYWPAYASGKDVLTNEEAYHFVDDAVSNGNTTTNWSLKVKRNVAGYLTGCCADYGLLERGRKQKRKIQHYSPSFQTSLVLTYDLHFSGMGDNAVMSNLDWELFGLQSMDVRDELKRLSLKGFLIMQTAGDITHIGWKYKTWEELLHVITKG